MTISSHERRWLLVATLIALFLANLPSLLGFLFPPHGTIYSGIDSTAPGDLNVYRSYMEQVVQGKYILRDIFTSEIQRPWIVNPFWIVLGLFSSLWHLSTLAVYFIARVIFGALLLFIIYMIAAELFEDIRIRRLAFLLGTFGGGLGAIGAIFSTILAHVIPHAASLISATAERTWPMDLWVSEGFTFLSLHHSPHFVAGTALILIVVGSLAQSLMHRSRRDAVLAGLAMLALYSFHPFHILSLGLTTVGFLVVAFIDKRTSFWSTFWNYTIAWLIATPALAYQVWAVVRDPFGQARAAQNILLTPDLPTTMVSYGLLLVGGIWGAVILLRRKTLKYQLLVTWAICHAAAIYLPIFFNRRVTQGLNVALAMLAAVGVYSAVETYFTRRGKQLHGVTLAVIIFLGFGLSTLWVSAQDLQFLLSNGRSFPYYFYLSTDYRSAFAFLKGYTPENTIILSSAITGNFIPGWSGRAVVVGHNVETLHFDDRTRDAKAFYSIDTTDEERTRILQKQNVTYVIEGPWEQGLGQYDPASNPRLERVYQQGQVTIYLVKAT